MRTSKGVPKQDSDHRYFAYRDDGCEVSPSCLACPLPECKYDSPEAIVRARKEARNRVVMELRANGIPPSEIAKQLGVAERTVFRDIADKTH